MIRVSKLMSDQGICSRREADHCIEMGWVKLNGEPVQLGMKGTVDDKITMSPDAEAWLNKKITLIINKPPGYVSAQAEDDHTPAVRLLTQDNQDRKPGDPKGVPSKSIKQLAPAGRLDIDSRGLLLMTSDGQVAKAIIGEMITCEKEYRVHFEGNLTQEKADQLRHGLKLDGQALKPAKVVRKSENCVEITLIEGKKRQIRRMFELINLEVTGLNRLRIGSVKIGALDPGCWRYLSKKEIFNIKVSTQSRRLKTPPK